MYTVEKAGKELVSNYFVQHLIRRFNKIKGKPQGSTLGRLQVCWVSVDERRVPQVPETKTKTKTGLAVIVREPPQQLQRGSLVFHDSTSTLFSTKRSVLREHKRHCVSLEMETRGFCSLFCSLGRLWPRF